MSACNLPRHPGLFATSRLNGCRLTPSSPPARDWTAHGAVRCAGGVLVDICGSRDSHESPDMPSCGSCFRWRWGLALVPRRGAGCGDGGDSGRDDGGCLQVGRLSRRGTGLRGVGESNLIRSAAGLDAAPGQRRLATIAAFALAGLASNLIALACAARRKALGWEAAGRRPLGEWLSQAVGTYVFCGFAGRIPQRCILFHAAAGKLPGGGAR